jgi:hypothetical protein
MARVKPEEVRVADPNDITAQAKQYSFLKAQIDYLEKQKKELHSVLMEKIDESGVVDDKGNIILDLPTEVDGYVAFMKQRRVSRKIDEVVAEEIITEKGLEDKLYKTIRVVDEDALMAAMWNDELTEEEVDNMYPQNVVWALVMNKG